MSEDKSFLKQLLTETWPARMAQDALKAVMLPGDVYQGKVSMYGDDGRTNPEVINRSADLAGLVTLGAGAVPAEANSLRSGIKAYHGSPHDFDRFDLSKIGTGEGAQAYGHGLYFADNEAVAKSYRDNLSAETGFKFNGKTNLTRDDVIKEIEAKYGYEFLDNVTRPSGIADLVIDAKRYGGNGERIKPGTQRRKLFDELMGQIEHSNPGSMYEVNINADPARFLDWDKPLSSQPESVVRAVENAMGGPRGAREHLNAYKKTVPKNLHAEFPSGGHVGDMVNVWDRPGSDINALLSRGAYSSGDLSASQKLREAGIPGIKYLDQGSRGAGEGSRNYVVFDDKIIDILKKYGLAGASASPLAALMAGQSQGELQQ